MIPALRIFFVGAISLCALSCARADFSDAYDVGASGSYNLVSGETTDFGTWSALLSTSGSGGAGSIDTSSAPGSLSLSVTGNPESGTGSLSFVHTGFAADGVVSFAVSGGSINVFLDDVLQAASGSAYSFSVTEGQVLKFSLSATGTPSFFDPGMPDPMNPGMWIIPPMMMPGLPTTLSITVSDFLAPIPEPASAAALVGGVLLVFAFIRSRRQA